MLVVPSSYAAAVSPPSSLLCERGMAASGPITKEELEVAGVLLQLPELFLEADVRPDINLIHWGKRKKRTGDSLIPPPPPPPPRPCNGGGAESKVKKRRIKFIHGGSSSSSANHASFSPTRGEETDSKPGFPPLPQTKPSKKLKRHKEWVKEESRTIAQLSEENVNLKKTVADARNRHQALKARNSFLKLEEMRLKHQHQPQGGEGGSLVLDPVEPIVGSPPPESPVDPTVHPHHQRQQLDVPPVCQPSPAFSIERLPAAGNRQYCVVGLVGPQPWSMERCERRNGMYGGGAVASAASGRRGVVLDLNVTPEEFPFSLGLQMQENVYRAAKSAQARKRRVEIKREKSAASASAAASSSVIFKMPPLRL